MADGRPIHGKNARILIDGNQIVGGNAWSISTTTGVVETGEFLSNWKKNIPGQKSWSGSITAYQHQDNSELIDSILSDSSLSIYLYPDNNDPTNFISGMAVFTTYSSDGGVDAAVNGNIDFVGDGELSFTGFA